jgi:hypothetical protein
MKQPMLAMFATDVSYWDVHAGAEVHMNIPSGDSYAGASYSFAIDAHFIPENNENAEEMFCDMEMSFWCKNAIHSTWRNYFLAESF